MGLQDSYIISGTESVEELRQVAEQQRRCTLFLPLNALRSMMEAFLERRMSAASLEDAAGYLEMNEAVLTLPEETARINDVLFMLANPAINGPTDSRKVRALRAAIDADSGQADTYDGPVK